MERIVAILALMPGLALAARPANQPKPGDPVGEAPPSLRMIISATTERIPLPRLRGTLETTTNALSHQVRLVPADRTAVKGLAARIATHVGSLCPKVDVRGNAVELTCRSARIEVQVTRQGKDSYLDINELRGLPWRAGPDVPPSYYYDPWRIGLGQRCPGKSPVVRGECELKDGHQLEAALQFRAALDTSGRQMACVRLGDLAAATGDPITAAGWYRRAGSFGSFGRVADARLCELDGKCLQTTDQVLHTFDASGLPEPLRAEMLVRGARAEAYAGRLPSAAHIIGRQVHAHGIASVCREDGALLCRRIVLEAMRSAQASFVPPLTVARPGLATSTRDSAASMQRPPLEKAEREYLEELIETYLAFPSWDQGDFAVELAQSAAPLAARLGAPAFGGNLVAALAPRVPDDRLAEHLLLAAETFMAGQNWARARIVAEYAQSRLGARAKGKGKGKRGGGGGADAALSGADDLQGSRWRAVFRTLLMRAEQDEVTPAVRAKIEAEFAATMVELQSARAVMDKAEGVLRGAREARSSATPPTPGTPATPAETATKAPLSSRSTPARQLPAGPSGDRLPPQSKTGSGRGTGDDSDSTSAATETADPSADREPVAAKKSEPRQ